jgi:small subunit ribosomal protein S13
MSRVAGVDLPRDKQVEIGLTYIHAIGRPSTNLILIGTGVESDIRLKDLSENEIARPGQFLYSN